MEKIQSPLWAAIALALGFAGGSATGTLDSGDKITATPIYDQNLSWQITSTPQGDRLVVKSFSSSGFPPYVGESAINLSSKIKNELKTLNAVKSGKTWQGSIVSAERASTKISGEQAIAKNTPVLTRDFIKKNLSKLCKDTAGLCEPSAPKKEKKK